MSCWNCLRGGLIVGVVLGSTLHAQTKAAITSDLVQYVDPTIGG